MEFKEYQEAALGVFGRWLGALGEARAESAAAVAALEGVGVAVPGEVRNYPRRAWERLAGWGGVADGGVGGVGYVDRTDDAGRPVPHICFKVPTGGGKTLLAAAALRDMNRQRGLVLWLTPTRAIYEQTRAALRLREHPYRQLLEIGSGGRVKFMEKDDLLTAGDAANYLCVMLMSLPAANRHRNREFLRMFRDSGRYPTFFPDGDDALGDGRLLERWPDLDRVSAGGPVAQSLFNVIKMLRPVVVLDEAHKAYGSKDAARNAGFAGAVSRLDPSMVIELSATPNQGISNLLVNVSGPDLRREQMIKAPVQVAAYTGVGWEQTLLDAAEKMKELEADAEAWGYSGGRYIRPIAVVRVERTGREQRDGERIHAEDVRECLHRWGVGEDAVRVKSSFNDELGRENLMSEYSPVRWIITKNALMEGWDCPFAYVLVMLDNTSAQRAITQLVGRVLRQPYVRYTGRAALDQCYVYCWNTTVGAAVNQVKNGLEQEGLSGLSGEVMGASGDGRRVTVERKDRFRGEDIFLPMVLHGAGGDGWDELDYQRHILPHIDWEGMRGPDAQGALGARAERQTASVDVGEARAVFHGVEELWVDKTVYVSWLARRLSDLVPGTWQGSRLAGELVSRLRADGLTDGEIYDQRSYLVYGLREWVKGEVERRAEGIFRGKLKGGEIRFELETGRPNFRMRDSFEIAAPEGDGLMAGNDGRQLKLSLFEPVYTRQFDSELERKFARYLDDVRALRWWHRVAVRQQGDYYLRGWRRERIWPDFVAIANVEGGRPHVLVFETKGGHLEGSGDTEYKRRVLETLEGAFNGGTMEIKDGPARGTFRLVFREEEFGAALGGLQGGYGV